MKLLLLMAIIAAVTSSPLTESQQWPWQLGKEYIYDVNSYTWTKFEQSNSKGNAFKTQFIIRVKAPGYLLAKLENPLYAQVQGQMDINNLPTDLKYQPVQKIDQPFEILVNGGRILSLSVPSSLSASHENLLKSLISALQVDLSTFGNVHSFPNAYDKKTFQGLFKKTETDLTGECETLYSVSPASAGWRRELPEFESDEEPIEITKSKNYGSCNKRVAYSFGVPEGVLWNGIAYKDGEKQFIKHTSESRLIVGKQGTIYKSETLSSVFVNPLLFGKQKAEVYSYVYLHLSSIQPESSTEWQKSVDVREIDSLLFFLSESTFAQIDTQNVVYAQRLLKEMTPLLQDPSNLPKADFLSKFNILVRLIMSLNSDQLSQLTNNIEVAKSSNNNQWIIYRDAVAQAGTIAAFKEIKSWILTKKIQGVEASEVITSASSVLRYPSKEIMTEFFDLALSPDVVEQKFLNTSALLAATKFIRSGKEDLYVVEKVIPRLSQELKRAIEQGDNTKAQVYVRVLGNLARPEILEVFAPYLDGRITVTKYLRIQMVISLKTLTSKNVESVTAVLFSILRNTAEPYEVRVAAALNIFLAFPTFEMVQMMAHMTKYDPSTQVRAVLVNGITHAAGLKNPRFAVLAKVAQSVLSSMSKEKLGYRLSTESLIDEYSSSDDITHFREVSYIGSENSFLPKYHRAALRLRGAGWTEENWYTLSVTNVQDLVNYIATSFSSPSKIDVDLKFSAKKIVEALNIKREPSPPLEGAFFIENFGQQKLFTFNEKELTAFISATVKNIEQLLTGVESHYTKVLNNKQVLITFPLATGVPFVYGYSEPTAFIINGKANTKVGMDRTASFNTKLQFTYARNLDGSVGFLDTLGGVYATTGIINKLQFYIPAKLNTRIKSKEVKFYYELPDENANLVHLSVLPYIALQNEKSLLTILEDPDTELIERSTKVVSTDLKVGELTGVVFQLKGYTYSSDYKDRRFFDADLLTNVRNFLYQKDVALTQFDLKYLATESKNKAVDFTLFYSALYNNQQSGEIGPASITEDIKPNCATRRGKIVKRVASGINSAKVQLVDISAVFEGAQKIEYVFTAALANSLVDNKSQAIIFAHGSEQINAVFKVTKPKLIPLNFEEALKNEIKATYDADIKIGNDLNLNIEGISERTNEYTQLLLKDPLAKQCLQDTKKGNFYQKYCHQVIIKAHAPDFFKATVTYKELSPAYLNITRDTYELLKQLFSKGQEVAILDTVDNGKIEIESRAFYYENYFDFEFLTKYGLLQLKNVHSLEHFPYTLAFYPLTSDWDRSYNWYTGFQNLPFCTVDDNKIRTFSGRNYDYSLTSSWHVVMVDDSEDLGKWSDLVILARRPSNKQEEVYISYRTESGKYVELEINPTTVEVKSNADKKSEGAMTTYWDPIAVGPILEYYTLTDGVLVLSLDNGALRLVYDSQRLVIFTNRHRSTTRGICGRSTAEISDDYLTPWGLVDLPAHYGASFSLDGNFSDLKTAELKKEAKLKAYQPVTKFTNILHSDAEWEKAENESVKGL